MSRNDFAGRMGLVTGAGVGIGRACAVGFGARGAVVGVVDVSRDAADETARLVEQAGGRATTIVADVSDEQDVRDAIARVTETLGGLDFAVNNAGIHGTTERLTEVAFQEWEYVLGVNLGGVCFGMKHELAEMVRRGGGAIVNISSSTGLNGLPNRPVYVASKHAVVGLSKAAAIDYAQHSVRVNCVCPGGTLTPLYASRHEAPPAGDQPGIPMGRVARAEEIAEVVIWLCSDSASYVTAAALPIDGGFSA